MAKKERFELRIDENILREVDIWREGNDNPSRAEAIRQLINLGLNSKKTPEITAGERLIIALLTDENNEYNKNLIAKALVGGNDWAIPFEYPSLYSTQTEQDIVKEVIDILDMWSFLEEGCKKFTQQELDEVKKLADVASIEFIGFDGNHEAEYLIVMDMLFDMRRFTNFKDRNLNSHMRMLPRYKRYLYEFNKIRGSLGLGAEIKKDQIIKILRSGSSA